MMHPETQEMISGPIAKATDLQLAIYVIEEVKADAKRRLVLKNKSITIQDSTVASFQDDDFKLLREVSYIQECLENGGWHGHLDYDADYFSIQTAVKSVKKFTL